MTKNTKPGGKGTVTPAASKKIALKAPVKSGKVVMPKLSANRNETLLER